MRFPALVALLAALTPRAAAQKAAPARAAAPARPAIQRSTSPAPSFAFGREAHPPSRFRRSSPRTSLPFPLFGDFNLDDLYSSGYPVSSQPPPVILLQAARGMAGSADSMARPENDRETLSTQPLMIELQGGRYVRIRNTAIDGEALPLNQGSEDLQPPKSTGSQSNRTPVIAAAPGSELVAAVLIFRDGRSEEVRDYTIADGILYARGDFYTDGYWNKKIDLSTLDLTQTLQANLNRNVKFVLPSSPNEVITRP